MKNEIVCYQTRLPVDIYQTLKNTADAEHRSINKTIIVAIEEYAKKKKPKRLLQDSK